MSELMQQQAIQSMDGQWWWDGRQWQTTFHDQMGRQAMTQYAPIVVAAQPVFPKSKGTAIVLACFLGLFTWLYTYKRDSGLFWLNVIVTFFTFGAWGLVAWIWAIIHTCVRSDEFYARFPNGG